MADKESGSLEPEVEKKKEEGNKGQQAKECEEGTVGLQASAGGGTQEKQKDGGFGVELNLRSVTMKNFVPFLIKPSM